MTEGEQERLRCILHDLSNVMTGVLMSGGLLRIALRGDRREYHAADVCEGGERGAALVREARVLVATQEEPLKFEAEEVSSPGAGYGESVHPQLNRDVSPPPG